MSRWVPAAVAVLLLAGCGAPRTELPGPDVGAPPPLEWRAAWTSCQAEVATGHGPDDFLAPLGFARLPADVTPAAVVVCAGGPQPRPGGGTDSVLAERRATDVARLTAALRLPDLPRTDGPCTADAVGVTWFAVIDAGGRWTRPGVPHDACGKPRIEVRQALEQLPTTTVSTTVLGEIESKDAANTGCGQAYAELVGVTAAEGRVTDGPVDLPRGEMRLCIFTVAKDEQGTGKPRGDFARGGRLTADAWSALRDDIAKLGATVPCTAHASRFALIGPPDRPGGVVSLELDGCHRLLIETGAGSVLKQADATLADRVASSL